jgi:hypothetical protein
VYDLLYNIIFFSVKTAAIIAASPCVVLNIPGIFFFFQYGLVRENARYVMLDNETYLKQNLKFLGRDKQTYSIRVDVLY